MTLNKKVGKNKNIIVFVTIVLLQIVFLTGIFVVKKTGYHEDEFFTYGLSNSYKYPYLYGSDLQVYDNYDVWLNGTDFKNYICTNEETKFKYDSVWYNQATDTNPPLHYAVIHTISSVFCGHFSWWYAFSVNLVCFVIFQIFFYLLNVQILHSEKLAILVCAFWGFTLAGQGLFLFLRMYAMLAAFTMAYVYLLFRFMKKDTFSIKYGAAIALTALGGALTQHLFLPFAFFITAFVCLHLLKNKKWKVFFGSGLSALIGIGLSFAIFPQTYDHLVHRRFQYSDTPDKAAQIKIMAVEVVKSLTGLTNSDISSTLFTVRVAIIFIIPIFLPLLFLFRKNIAEYLRKRKQSQIQSKKQEKKKTNSSEIIILFLSCIIVHIIVSGSFYYYEFFEDSIRYLYHIIPFVLLIGAFLLKKLYDKVCRLCLKKFFRIGGILLLCGVLVFQNIRFDPQYVISADPENGRISEYTSGQNCILLPLDAIFLPTYCNMMKDSADIYETIMDGDHYRTPDCEKEYQKIFEKNKPFILIFDSSPLLDDDYYEVTDHNSLNYLLTKNEYGEHWTKKEILSYFEALSGYSSEYCTAETTNINRIVAYRFIPPKE